MGDNIVAASSPRAIRKPSTIASSPTLISNFGSNQSNGSGSAPILIRPNSIGSDKNKNLIHSYDDVMEDNKNDNFQLASAVGP